MIIVTHPATLTRLGKAQTGQGKAQDHVAILLKLKNCYFKQNSSTTQNGPLRVTHKGGKAVGTAGLAASPPASEQNGLRGARLGAVVLGAAWATLAGFSPHLVKRVCDGLPPP